MNTRAVPLVRYSGPFLKRTREEFKQMEQRTRKLKTLHLRDDVDRQYLSRKRGRWLAIIEENVDVSRKRLADYIEKHEGILITTTRNNTDNTRSNRTEITRKTKMGRKKKLYRRFKRPKSDTSYKKTWTWLRKGNLEKNWISSNFISNNDRFSFSFVDNL